MTGTIQIVKISGKQGSGKTTLAKEIYRRTQSLPGIRAHLINFADPLYEMHNFCLGVLKSAGIERDLVKDGPLLQLLGTEWGRKTVDENIWLTIMKARIKKQADNDVTSFSRVVFIIADCRFKNEFDAIPEALRIRLECDKDTRQKRCEMWRPNDTHPSEIDLDDYVYANKFDMIFNTATSNLNHYATLIMAQLDKNNWIEKRIP